MAKHLQRELDKIKQRILSLGALVEERVRMAVDAIEERDGEIAAQIIHADHEIDEMEVEIEEECLKILALHQPVAVDLRFLIAVIKINNELERIGDQAVNIAQRISTIAKKGEGDLIFDYSAMATKTASMLKMSLDALVNLDEDMAFRVVTQDDEVDELQTVAYDRIKAAIKASTGGTGTRRAGIGHLINLLLISRHLERLGDHATNIAEEVIYLIEGEIVRHGNY